MPNQVYIYIYRERERQRQRERDRERERVWFGLVWFYGTSTIVGY